MLSSLNGEGANKKYNSRSLSFCKIIYFVFASKFLLITKSIDGNDVLSHLRVNGLSRFFSVKGAMKGFHTKGFHRVLRNFLHDLSFFSTHFQ